MKASYHVVIVSLIASFVLGIGLFVYRYVFPKKTIPPLMLLVLFSLLPIISVFRPGVYESGDLKMHTMFALSFFDSLSRGVLIPRWAGEVYFGLGYPLFLFIYPFPYYLASLFHLLGLSMVASMKSIIIGSYVLSGVFMYIWTRKKLNQAGALTAAIFYLFAPYHLVDMHFRVAIGEILAFPIIPLCFYFAEKMVEDNKLKWSLFLTFSLIILLLSHQAIFLIILPFLISYIIFLWKNNKNYNVRELFSLASPFMQAVLLSAFYWLPLLVEARNYTHLIPHPDIVFQNITEFFYSPWRGGFLFQGPKGELSFLIGYVQWGIILLALIILLRNKAFKHKQLLVFFLTSFFLSFLLMQAITKPVWDFIFILKNFQFSFRLLLLTSFFISVLAGIMVTVIKMKWFFYLICFLAIGTTILNWGNRRTIPTINDQTLTTELPYLLGQYGGLGPGIPIWYEKNKIKPHKPLASPIEILSGKAEIKALKHTSNRHEYIIYTSRKATFQENTLYFPGWVLFVNHKQYNYSYEDRRNPGIIIFTLPAGVYNVELTFTDTPVRTYAKIISAVSLFALILFIIIKSSFMLKLVSYKRGYKLPKNATKNIA